MCVGKHIANHKVIISVCDVSDLISRQRGDMEKQIQKEHGEVKPSLKIKSQNFQRGWGVGF